MREQKMNTEHENEIKIFFLVLLHFMLQPVYRLPPSPALHRRHHQHRVTSRSHSRSRIININLWHKSRGLSLFQLPYYALALHWLTD